MPHFRVSYTFVHRFAGDEDAIRKAVRDLPFSTAFDPADLNGWRVRRTEVERLGDVPQGAGAPPVQGGAAAA